MREYNRHNIVNRNKQSVPIDPVDHEVVLKPYAHVSSKKNIFGNSEESRYFQFVRHFPYGVEAIFAERKSHRTKGNAFQVHDSGFSRLWMVDPLEHKWHEEHNTVTVVLRSLDVPWRTTYFVEYDLTLSAMEVEWRKGFEDDNYAMYSGDAKLREIRMYRENFVEDMK